MRRIAVIAAVAAVTLAAAAAMLADFADTLPPGLTHPAIDYYRSRERDPVPELNRRLEAGSAQIAFEGRGGYLRGVLDALDVPVESQVVVFSKTSLQADRIEPANPRAIFFNDQVAVAWMWGGFIEVAAQDPVSGSRFYTLEQNPARRPRFVRDDSNCLRCHHADATLGVAGPIVRSTVTGAEGEPMLIYGSTLIDHRTPFAERWGGYYVTGAPGGMRHMGNHVVTDRDRPNASAPREALGSLGDKFRVSRYLSPYSDLAALLVFDHQMHLINLITRFGWEVRAAEVDRSANLSRLLAEGAREVADYMLFVGEARFAAPLAPVSAKPAGFAAAFAARGPRDAKGRSLRDLDLATRLMKYPLSYLIYAPAFDALPPAALDAVYRELHRVLSGEAAGNRYAHLTPAVRRAVIEILRETKPGLPEYFR